MTKKYKTLLANMGLFFIASFIPKTISFFLVPLYTYCLSTSDYGSVDLLTHTVQLIIPFLTLQVQDAVLRFAMDKEYDQKHVFSIGLSITMVGGLILLFVSGVCAVTNLICIPISFWAYFIVSYFTGSLNSIFSYFCRGIGKIRILTVSSIVMTLVTISCNLVFLLLLGWGVNGYLLANSIGAVVNISIIFLGAELNKYLVFSDLSKDTKRKMILFSVCSIIKQFELCIILQSQ